MNNRLCKTVKNLFPINIHLKPKLTKMMKASTNLFENFSPLFTHTMSLSDKEEISNSKSNLNFEQKSTNRNTRSFHNLIPYKTYDKKIMNKSLYNYKTYKNLRHSKEELLSPKNPPILEDKIKLASYYKISGAKKKYKNLEEKRDKYFLFEKYDIKTERHNLMHLQKLGHSLDKNVDLRIITSYFDNSKKAEKVIDVNKQLVHRVNEISNFFLIKKYLQNIENSQKKIILCKKMPKIHIKTKKQPKLKKENIFEKKIKSEIKPANKKLSQADLQENLNSLKKINLLGIIKMKYFKKIASNELIENKNPNEEFIIPTDIEDTTNNNEINIQTHKRNSILKNSPKKNKEDEDSHQKRFDNLLNKKSDKHYLILNISKISPAYKPCSRVNFSISINQNNLYLFGGLYSIISNDLWKYDIEKNKWSQIIYKQNDDPCPRHSHTSIIINENLFLFGGEGPKDKPLEDLVIFHIPTEKFYFPTIQKKKNIKSRKGHICVGTNSCFLIQGGIDIRTQEIDNRAFIYNIPGSFWHKLEIVGAELPKLAYHCASMVNNYIHEAVGNYSFYYPPKDFQQSKIRKLIYEGIYIFGGINDKKIFMNELFIIKIGQKPCVGIKPKIRGIPPEPRINAKMLYIEDYSFLIIHGGTKVSQYFCDDLVILNLENLNWLRPLINVDSSFGSLIARGEHQIFFSREKMYIFGGIGNESLLSMNFETVEFGITGFYDNISYNNDSNENDND